jgi:hypothetical protein
MFHQTRRVNLVSRVFSILILLMAVTVTLGDEPWSRHCIDSSRVGADGVRLADFNHDGHLDIVTGWEESGVVRLYLNPGPIKSKQTWPHCEIGKGRSPEDAVPFDIDGDGILEVISCHEGTLKQVLVHKFASVNKNATTGLDDNALLDPSNWSTTPVSQLDGQMWMFATPIELNESRRGIVIGSKGGQATLTLLIQPNIGETNLDNWLQVKLRDCGWVMSIQNIDMDHDGDIDIVFSDRKSATRAVAWLEQPNKNAEHDHWVEHRIGATDTEPLFIEATPNRILVSTRKSNWIDFRKTENGIWEPTLFDNPRSVPFGKAIRMLGKNNIVLTANTAADRLKIDQPGIWLRSTEGDWKAIGSKNECKFDRMELIDLDADGDLDILTCEERQQLGVVWYENPGIK